LQARELQKMQETAAQQYKQQKQELNEMRERSLNRKRKVQEQVGLLAYCGTLRHFSAGRFFGVPPVCEQLVTAIVPAVPFRPRRLGA
jgi:hypothetical protein